MRAWLAILTEEHPQYTWIPAEQKSSEVRACIERAALASGALVSEQIVRAA